MGGKKSHLLYHIVEDIYMKKSLSFYTIDLKTLLTFPYEGASIENFSMILTPRWGNVPFMFPFDKLRTVSCSISFFVLVASKQS